MLKDTACEAGHMLTASIDDLSGLIRYFRRGWLSYIPGIDQ